MKKRTTYNHNFIDNRGTSIIELLVVMAIMAVLLGASTNIVGYLSGKQAKQCAYKMEAMLAETRMETMSKSTGEKDSVYLSFRNDDGKIYVDQTIKGTVNSALIGSNVTVKAKDVKGVEKDLVQGAAINVYFNRSTGALYDEADNYCEFRVSQGTKTYVVTIVPTTGKISYERE